MQHLDYLSPTEATDFQAEFARLDQERYLKGERPVHLLHLYRRFLSGLTPFSAQLREATPPQQREPFLLPWLTGWVEENRFRDPLFDIQLYLAARGVDEDILRQSFGQPGELCSPNELGILRAAPATALRQWYELLEHPLEASAHERGFHLLLVCFFQEGAENPTTEELLAFLTTAYPLLQKIFHDHPFDHDQLADWCKLWLHHHRHGVPNIPDDHAYYGMEFTTILSYVPRAIWWKNGLPYRNGEKAFTYYSEEFFWLATGGSLRKLPDHPPYSKRMAKEFNNYPFTIGIRDNDTYVYCWLRSLACDYDMIMALQRFFQRPTDPDRLIDWKTRLDPIVQRLQTFDIAWVNDPHDALLGYLYHLVRDQPDFNISGRTYEQLLQDAAEYYARIETRRAERERLAAERAARAGATPAPRTYWDPLRGVQAWEEEYGRYDSVRKRQIVELTTQESINAESRSMKHCVSTYYQACRAGQTSIWSLRELRQNGQWYSLLTIEIRPKIRTIVQVRGRFNASPKRTDYKTVSDWATREKLQFIDDLY